jgi:hypothetical protein
VSEATHSVHRRERESPVFSECWLYNCLAPDILVPVRPPPLSHPSMQYIQYTAFHVSILPTFGQLPMISAVFFIFIKDKYIKDQSRNTWGTEKCTVQWTLTVCYQSSFVIFNRYFSYIFTLNMSLSYLYGIFGICVRKIGI